MRCFPIQSEYHAELKRLCKCRLQIVIGRLLIELNHILLFENNVVLTLHYVKIMES